jgi:hypothetical protein
MSKRGHMSVSSTSGKDFDKYFLGLTHCTDNNTTQQNSKRNEERALPEATRIEQRGNLQAQLPPSLPEH